MHAGGRTPSYGYMTPSHDPSQTPLHGGSAWDPTVANTPARYVCCVVVASYPGLLTPAFVACSINVEEGLVKLSHVQ